MAQRTIAAVALGLTLAALPSMTRAGDWREFVRSDGYSIAFNAQGIERDGDRLTVEVVVALLPERQLPLYGISRMNIDCKTRDFSMGAFQFHLANGDPFGKPTEEKPGGVADDDHDLRAICANELPPSPGAESALTYFKSLYADAP